VSEHSGHAPGLWPVPGDGVLARRGNLILLSSVESAPLVDALLDVLERVAAAGGDGRAFANAVADAVEEGQDVEQAVLAFGPAGTGLAVTVSAGAWADVTTVHGTARVQAGQPGMVIRCLLRAPASAVRAGLRPGDNGAASTDRFSRLDAGLVRAGGLSFILAETAAAGTAAVPFTSAEAGPAVPEPAAPDQAPAAPAQEPGVPEALVPEQAAHEQVLPDQVIPDQMPPAPDVAMPTGGGAATELWTMPPSEEPETGPAAEAGPGPAAERQATMVSAPGQLPGEPFEAVLLAEAGAAEGLAVPARLPLPTAGEQPPGTTSYVSATPIIQGVYCKNGHFDDPEALFCAVCGISMNQQTLVPRPGARPPLGVLVVDDGAVFQLDGDYVVGREPTLDSAVASGHARALRIADDSGIVSRVHARVHLDGWRVLVTDLGSANGTKVRLPQQTAETALVPQVPLVLAAGSQVDLGGRGFRYESHRGR